jgi:drug/metabolite transporter (DMT)-like permease
MNSKVSIIVAFFAIYVIWGSTYLLNKIAVMELDPLFVSAIRFSIAGLLIFIIAKIMKLNTYISKNQLINSMIAGFLFLVYGNGVFIWALKYVDSGFAALIASTQPLFVLLLLRLMDNKKMQKKSLIGITLGVIGMYLLVSQKDFTSNESMILGVFMILSCVLSWSYGSVFVSKADLPSNFLVSTGYQMLAAGALLFLSSFLFGEEWVSPLNWSVPVQWSILLLILLQRL